MSPASAQPDPTMWTSLLHAGLAGSFMGFPHVPAEAGPLQSHGARAAIYGIPFDATNISRTGANYGPRGIREVSCQFLTYNAMLDFDLAEALSPVDCGDCDIALANPETTFARAQHDLGEILAAGALPVTFGGDHSVTIPAVRAVRGHAADPGLVLVDTHLDTAVDVGATLEVDMTGTTVVEVVRASSVDDAGTGAALCSPPHAAATTTSTASSPA